MDRILSELAATIEERRNADPATSYVASLSDKGLDAILKKIGEEATETVVAAKNGNAEQIIHETADLWFHSMIMLSRFELGPEDILNELARRFGQSGLEEKASRSRSR